MKDKTKELKTKVAEALKERDDFRANVARQMNDRLPVMRQVFGAGVDDFLVRGVDGLDRMMTAKINELICEHNAILQGMDTPSSEVIPLSLPVSQRN